MNNQMPYNYIPQNMPPMNNLNNELRVMNEKIENLEKRVRKLEKKVSMMDNNNYPNYPTPYNTQEYPNNYMI